MLVNVMNISAQVMDFLNMTSTSKWKANGRFPDFVYEANVRLIFPMMVIMMRWGGERGGGGHYRGGDWSEKIGNYWGSGASRGAFSVGKQNLKEPTKIYWLWNCSVALEEQEDQAALWIYMIKKDWYFILMCLNFSICHQHYCKFKCGVQQ